ncbi:glycosyltransferase family 4 protein [Microbulbifer thermotolerans]|uniref:Uncharacterized protein n=1 Tax=Microbulbifer thermotolerans TaxID=252514 RepID=A0A143HLR9_MICTH|nr:glycosyltransferase family 4 protein [Microbulbifer thermotolerans]AMX02664.1 hypothetical protein A3224_08765 [Microbulbifer thermotolerans]MCX2794486.1 glycosyltransferase family 4 protein [Microbulbifer thermotolerans]SFB89598.1 Glycosyltransferase involved in cell wall bisynthesis [Microbulbifer thermotolerans]
MRLASESTDLTKERVKRTLVFLINVDWYFLLHWKERAIAAKFDGWDVCIVTRVTEKKFRDEIVSLGFKLLDVPIVRHSFNPLFELKSLVSIARALSSIDVALIHAITIKPICYSLLISKVLKKPIVASFPGLGKLRSDVFISRSVWLFLKVLLKTTSGKKKKRALATFENGDDYALTKKKGLLFSSVEVLPGAGVNLNEYPLLCQPEKGETVRILFAARLLKSKGIKLLEDAVARLVREGYKLELVIAGIPDESHIDRLDKEDIQALRNREFIRWLGRVEDMIPTFSQCDIVCLPTSYGEGIPRILIEGAACGRPLVATDVPGCREIVRHRLNGLLIQPGDVDSLVIALKTLVTNKDLRYQFGLAGRKLVENHFSSEKVISQTLRLYKSSMRL